MSPAFSLVVAALVVAGGQALPSRLGGDTVDPQDGKIVGGTESTIERFPYQIAMHNNDRFRCGGSILNENYILTAAHCINTLTGTYALAVRAGSSDRRAGGQYIRVAKMSYHSKFREATMSYDVAILKLMEPLTFNNLVKPVELVAVGNEPKTGTTLTLSGWGVTKSGSNSIPETLRTVDVKVKSRVQCRIPYLILLKWVTDEMICAAAGGKDTCQGDSGGPAVNEEGKQVGIVSFGAGCAFWPFNGVYTNVANKDIRAFIDDRLQNL